MTPEVRQRIVLVEAEFADGKRGFGTGFRVLPGRVLTSQHVIRRRAEDGTLEKAKRLKVLVDRLGDDQVESAPAEELWIGDPEARHGDLNALDAAILADELPVAGLDRFTDLIRVPAESARWDAAGYVGASQNRHFFRPDELWGHCGAIKEKERFLELSVEREEPVDRQGKKLKWSGVSGGPVFLSEGSRKGHLYGVVRLGPVEYPKTIYAVAMPALLRDAGFRAAIDFAEPPPPHERLVLETRRLLSDQPDLARNLASLDDQWAAGWRGATDCEGLLEAMARHGDLKTLIGGLLSLAEELQKDDPARLAPLRESAVHLVGLLAHHELLRRGHTFDAAGEKIGIANPDFVEAARAAAQGRRVYYRRKRKNRPRAELQVLPSRLESGLRRSKKGEDQLEEMFAKLVAHDLSDPPWLDDSKKEIIEGGGEAERLALQAKAIGISLRDLRKEKRGAPYLVVTPKLRKGVEGEQLGAFLEYLRGVLPDLEQVQLEGDASEALDFDELLQPLWKVLGIN